jgi:hypothetical protein
MNAGDSQILQDVYWARMDASNANEAAIAEAKNSLAGVLAVGVALDVAITRINADPMTSDLAKQAHQADQGEHVHRGKVRQRSGVAWRLVVDTSGAPFALAHRPLRPPASRCR